MRKTVTGALVIFMCLFMFVGCYRGNTLEERISDADRQRLITLVKTNEEFKDFSDFTMEVEENHITFKAYLGVPLDQLQVTALKSQIQQVNMDGQIVKLKDAIEKGYKIRPSIITLEYYGADSRLIGKIEG